MEPGKLPDGTAQSFYWPDDHERTDRRGWFKGMAQILRERGLHDVAAKQAECPGFQVRARANRLLFSPSAPEPARL
ncbi:hypothetical protein CTheo_8934 [Ceratobasidium theobromae]|uniref:Uncharacterized protein n=1 Tax=Ceratobasidium theobromae TaxID=1582974 RepID=A0A5N5Q8A5_9AGAM|nr:hypothetical protein CTheo_8934 [Ceratobasidium theobromae]